MISGQLFSHLCWWSHAPLSQTCHTLLGCWQRSLLRGMDARSTSTDVLHATLSFRQHYWHLLRWKKKVTASKICNSCVCLNFISGLWTSSWFPDSGGVYHRLGIAERCHCRIHLKIQIFKIFSASLIFLFFCKIHLIQMLFSKCDK